jgi:FkbM family methyltransferase
VLPDTPTYGHHAQNDRWICDLVFPGLRGGYFVEAGACGGLQGSASYVLEKHFGWNGICVEPYDPAYAILVDRRSCETDNRCLADVTGDTVEFLQYPDDPARSGIEALNKNRATWARATAAASTVSTKETVTLGDLLEQHRAPEVIHFLCLDVEGAERTILGAFDFAGPHRLLAISVEGPSCDDLLMGNGYRQVANPFAPKHVDRYFLHPSMPGTTEG